MHNTVRNAYSIDALDLNLFLFVLMSFILILASLIIDIGVTHIDIHIPRRGIGRFSYQRF